MEKLISVILLILLLVSGCRLFDNDDKSNFGHCEKELFEQVKKDGSVRVIATYEMEYTPEEQLTEQERQAQREAIAEMHDKLLSNLKEKNISGVSRSTGTPRINIGVNNKSLSFLCTTELVKEVRLERTFQTNRE
ncbi:hypothetical protein [Gracilimonas sp.]|uniref:hypothetical protein n=1 Tax=Gracilimonas sp. TaxID=1974203 RepID=UPI0032F0038A